MSDTKIVVQGAREHNLRNVNLAIPRDRLVVFTGVSGSGKSSLAFDTLYAEGQRRYIESLSAAARQYVGQIRRPDVDRIEGLSPAVSIQQKATDANPRSTVATVTEIYDYLRVLFARVGDIVCHGAALGRQSTADIIKRIETLPEGSRLQLLAPVVRQRRGEFREIFEDARKAGFVRVRVNGEVLDLASPILLDRRRRHDIEIVVDRLIVKPDLGARLADSVELALSQGGGQLVLNVIPADEATVGEDILFSRDLACPVCGTSYTEPTPQMFSFNSVQGMCPTCQGLGVTVSLDPELTVPDPGLSINQGAVAPWGVPRTLHLKHILDGLADHFAFDLDAPWQDLPEDIRQIVLFGSAESILFTYCSGRGRRYPYQAVYQGVAGTFNRDGNGPTEPAPGDDGALARFVRETACPACHGQRLRPEALQVRLAGLNISDVTALTIAAAAAWFDALDLQGQKLLIGEDLVREIRGRLNFLLDVGLHYLSLDRSAPSLSGGEGQRIRLASQIGAGLVGVTYVLDEPSIGLHHRDNKHLLRTLQRLRDLGNTVIVVEHDEETMRAADFLVDIGPGPGRLGGEIVAAGEPEAVAAATNSLTADYLTGRRQIALPEERRPVDPERVLTVRGAQQHNLQGIDVSFPLGCFIGVTGVSGSGKSSLVNDILHVALARALHRAESQPGLHDAIEGLELLDKVISIDQSPIGRTPRSNPATYTKALDPIRTLFARLPEAKVRGYAPGRFSFNVAEGRCEACEGLGYQRVEMDFLDDVWLECEKCDGRRFNQDTLQVKYKGRNIAEVLSMSVAEALEHFAEVPPICRVLQTLVDVGLDYLQLGQPAPTLSGGEAQRIKLARELSRRSTGRTLYLLDEPTTGLHFEDIAKLLVVLNRFVDEGNTVVVIEHNLDVIKCCDHLLDLGPEGGAGGGLLVASGTPEEVARVDASHTGVSLREVLGTAAERQGSRVAPVPAGARPSPWAPLDEIVVKGARVHNLKNLDAVIPRRKLTVLTGVSGSGKSSLALDTIYAEGQRRYVESLSSYARQFIRQLEKPPVDFVSGLSPAISIEQRPGSRNPRSTVGTITEVYDYLRLLWARLGERHCVDDGGLLGRQTVDEMVARIQILPPGTQLNILCPLVLGRVEGYDEAFERLRRDGFLRVRINGEIVRLDEGELPRLDRRRRHQVEVVIDRVRVDPDRRGRVAEAVEVAVQRGDGQMIIEVLGGGEAGGVRPGETLFSQRWTCAECGRAYDDLSPQSFSFNSPLGWCETCEGLGTKLGIDPDLVIRHRDLSLGRGAVPLLRAMLEWHEFKVALETVAKQERWPMRQPLQEWRPEQLQLLVHGSDQELTYTPQRGGRATVRYPGLVGMLNRLVSYGSREEEIRPYLRDLPCPTCSGGRLRPEAAAVRFRGRTIAEVAALPLAEAERFFATLELDQREDAVGAEPLREVRRRLRFLCEVGLTYLSLNRASGTLSGGESQRIRLASQIGGGLTGVLYILDEPTIGLHQRDNARLLQALANLRDLGNTVLMVEHDEEAIRSADHVIDFGPGAGSKGGQIVASGPPERLSANGQSLTAAYLSGERRIAPPPQRRAGNGGTLSLSGVRHHNLRDLTVHLPLGCLVAVTGVSGSGKSSLVSEVIYPALARQLHRSQQPCGAYERLEGIAWLDKVIQIDQRPIGDNPRSNPLIYVGCFDLVRELFSQLPESRARGYTVAEFSFNRPGGRCEACWGFGSRKIEMHFLADVWVPCEACGGKRYTHDILQIQYRGKSIADVLEMSVAEALEHFSEVPRVRRPLQTLSDVGLDYLALGQSALTLSGGEAQRVKLARELSRPATGQTLYVLDEPTTGLHFEDIRRLLEVLDRLVEAGNTVVVIEHNLDVIAHADHVIDLGPEGGEAGGEIVVAGTPEEVVACSRSHTGQVLSRLLQPDRAVAVAATAAAADVISDPDERWHRRQQAFSHQGDANWTPETLDRLVQWLGALSPEVTEPDWRSREFVQFRIAGDRRWWVRLRTSHPECLRLRVRTDAGLIGEGTLRARSGLRPWNELEPPIDRQGGRVRLKYHSGGDEAVFELVHAEEFENEAFRELVLDLLRQFTGSRA